MGNHTMPRPWRRRSWVKETHRLLTRRERIECSALVRAVVDVRDYFFFYDCMV
jgi:hypothetical protein